jgi:hypothetical protein
MNKKFFTLIAGALVLVASLGTANAQIGAYAAGAKAVDKFSKFPNADGKLYQLFGNGNKGSITPAKWALVVRENGRLDIDSVGLANPYSGQYGESLWCVNFETDNEGQHPKINLDNKAYGYSLKVSEDDVQTAVDTDPVNVSVGTLGGWGFSETYETVVQTGRVLFTHYSTDSVLVLGFVTRAVGTPAAGDSLVVYKASAATPQTPANPTVVDPAGLSLSVAPIYFTIVEPAPLVLTAHDFNTILNTQKAAAHKLTFVKDRNKTTLENPWSDINLIATDSKNSIPTGQKWLNFAKVDASGKLDSTKFLRVDTSYINTTGNKYLGFAYDTIYKNAPIAATTHPIAGQYDFHVRYHVSNDSMSIQVREARFNLEDKATWYDSRVTSETEYTGGSSDIANILPGVTKAADSLFVKLQDLVKADEIRVITIGTRPAETRIELGLKGCEEPQGTTLTSLDEDVYVIHNAAGQVLGVPIFTDSTTTNKGVQWIKYSTVNVDPNYIPAYQWVVKKRRANSPGTSPVVIYNREFPDEAFVTSLQLFTDKASSLFTEGVTKASFTPVPKAQKADKKLGYFYIGEQEAKLNSYDLNYLHSLSTDYFLGKSDVSGDSTLLVKKTKTQYKFTPVSSPFTYGYKVTNNETIKDLVQLERVAYVLTTGGKWLTVNENERYALTSTKYTQNGTSAAFLLKTNNTTKDGEIKQYYALLDTLALAKYPALQPKTYLKVGISDDNLWAFAQVQKETRTSAFAPSVYSSPLYRRFDNGDYTYGNGQETTEEPHGAKDNAPVWLKFTKKNNLGNEFLFENSPIGTGSPTDTTVNDYRQNIANKNISFLGLYNKNQYPGIEYTFYVDTAYSARPAAGAEATSTAYTAKPQYMLAVRPVIRDTVTIYKVDQGWYEDSEGNRIPIYGEYDEIKPIHFPALTRGYYVYNAQDSVNVGNKDYEGKKAYGAEGDVRLAFVDGVHMADTFYVLPKGIIGKEGLDYEAETSYLQEYYKDVLYRLPDIYKHYLGENTHYVPRLDASSTAKNHKYNYVSGTKLQNGKSMVFQFRLITSEVNKDRNFLIETTTEDGEQMGPDKAKWVKINNGVPVISDAIPFYDASNFNNGAEIFNVTEGKVDGATSNEAAPAVSAVKVISETGAVTILNAAGKKVAISNVLGQTVAGTVLSSDNARITLPKGIVIVAVEGEAAIKAIVK